MINTDLKFRAEYFVPTKVLKLTDLLADSGYTALLDGYSELPGQVVGIFKAQSPIGVFYGGTAYTNNDFSLPDTVGGDDEWYIDNISLPTSETDILCGAYNFYYKMRLTLLGTLKGFGSGYFSITGDDYSLLFGSSPVGMKVQVFSADTPTGNEGTYTITGMSYVGGDTRITVAESVSDFTADADDILGIILETSKGFNFCYEAPETDIDNESSCIYSTLTATDDSDYTVNFGSYGTKTPTITRAWRVQCPVNYSEEPVEAGNVNPLIIGYGTSYNSGADIWTGSYITEMTSTLSYSVELWGAGVYWVLIHDTIVSTSPHEVKCDTCFCDIKQCIENLYNKYKGYLNTNPTKAKTLLDKLVKVYGAWMMYQIEERCGGDYATWCAEISQIVLSEDCQCHTDTFVSKEVVPLSLQVNGVLSNPIISFGSGGSGFPSDPTIGDVHFFNADGGGFSTGDIYFYTNFGWVFQFNIIGSTGATGATGSQGVQGVAGADGVAVVFDNTLETATTVTGGSYGDFTGMSTGALTNLTAKGDMFIISALFETSAIGKTADYVQFLIDGQQQYFTYVLPAFVIEIGFFGNVKFYHVKITATVTDVSSKKIMLLYEVMAMDSFSNEISSGKIQSLLTVSDIESIVIKAQGKIGASGTVGCKFLNVQFLKK